MRESKLLFIHSDIDRIKPPIYPKSFIFSDLINVLESIKLALVENVYNEHKSHSPSPDDEVLLIVEYHNGWVAKGNSPFFNLFPKHIPLEYKTSYVKVVDNSYELVHTAKIKFGNLEKVGEMIDKIIEDVNASYQMLGINQKKVLQTNNENVYSDDSSKINRIFKNKSCIEDIFSFYWKLNSIKDINPTIIDSDKFFIQNYFSVDKSSKIIVKTQLKNDVLVKDFCKGKGIKFENGELEFNSKDDFINVPDEISSRFLNADIKQEVVKSIHSTSYFGLGEHKFLDNEKENDVIIGVFDGAVSKNSNLGPLINFENNNSIPDNDKDYDDHAEAVASIAAYNHIANKGVYDDGLKGFEVKIFEIVGIMNRNEESILNNIRKVLIENSDKIKIYIMSMNFNQPSMPLRKISDFSNKLDLLQKEFNVRFIISASNAEELQNFNEEYINPPADSIESLVVGGHDGIGGNYKFSKKGFSTFLPLKPDLAEFAGGNSAKQMRTILDGELTIIPSGGTSFAAPLAARKYAYLFNIIKRNFDSQPIEKILLIVDSLMINSAIRNQNTTKNEPDIYYGWGALPELAEEMIDDNNGNTKILIFSDTLETKSKSKANLIYFPTSNVAIEGIGEFELLNSDIYCTICSNPDYDNSRGVEYIQSSARITISGSENKEQYSALVKAPKNIDPTADKKITNSMISEINLIDSLGKYKNRINTLIKSVKTFNRSRKKSHGNEYNVTLDLDSKKEGRDKIDFGSVITIVGENISDIDYKEELTKKGWIVQVAKVQIKVKT